jgi:hypothetical protein
MSAKDVYGTPIKLTLGGTTFRVAADADPKDGKPSIKNEGEQTTGGLFRKMTAQDEAAESWTLKVNGDELSQLKAIAESSDDITMSYETRAGDVYRATGFIDYDGRQQASGKVELKLFPRNGWTPFIA